MTLGMLLMISVGRNSVHTSEVRPLLAVLLFLPTTRGIDLLLSDQKGGLWISF